MTLEQFAGLMVGLGYKAEKGSRLKAVSEDRTAPKTEINQAPVVETVGDLVLTLKKLKLMNLTTIPLLI